MISGKVLLFFINWVVDKVGVLFFWCRVGFFGVILVVVVFLYWSDVLY